MEIDWIPYYTEEEYMDFEAYYEAMAEKEDLEYEDNFEED